MDGLRWTAPRCPMATLCPLLDPVANEFDVDLTYMAAVSILADRTQLDTTDRQTTVRLTPTVPPR